MHALHTSEKEKTSPLYVLIGAGTRKVHVKATRENQWSRKGES